MKSNGHLPRLHLARLSTYAHPPPWGVWGSGHPGRSPQPRQKPAPPEAAPWPWVAVAPPPDGSPAWCRWCHGPRRPSITSAAGRPGNVLQRLAGWSTSLGRAGSAQVRTGQTPPSLVLPPLCHAPATSHLVQSRFARRPARASLRPVRQTPSGPTNCTVHFTKQDFRKKQAKIEGEEPPRRLELQASSGLAGITVTDRGRANEFTLPQHPRRSRQYSTGSNGELGTRRLSTVAKPDPSGAEGSPG